MLKGTLLLVGIVASLSLMPRSAHATRPKCCVCYGCPTATGGSSNICITPPPPDTTPDGADLDEADESKLCSCPTGCTLSKSSKQLACTELGAICDPSVKAPALSQAALAGLLGMLAFGGVIVVRRRTAD